MSIAHTSCSALPRGVHAFEAKHYLRTQESGAIVNLKLASNEVA